ncbi:DUF3465 domain-containing protein [Shewanella pneumatophori]
MRYTGQLVRWNDAKGFGFIHLKTDSKTDAKTQADTEVFIHVSALQNKQRRPLIGDVIEFNICSDNSGRPRAEFAQIDQHAALQASSQALPADSALATSANTEHSKAVKGVLIRIILMLVALAIASFATNSVMAASLTIQQAYEQQQSNQQVQASGVVTRILPDDNEGSRHQKFIVKLAHGQTILIAHNIDLAPRIPALNIGDTVTFFGEYEWNKRGGVVHWTHHDPAGRHIGGWLKHNGKTYQ